MKHFKSALAYTLLIGFTILGVLTGLALLKIAIGIVGAMLGSAVGTILMAYILWKAIKCFWKTSKENKER